MKIVCLSDTHGSHKEIKIPDGDVIIHAGDFTAYGYESEVFAFNMWIGELSHEHKIVIAGNHDTCLETNNAASRSLFDKCIYLQDEAYEIDGIKFYGTPWQPYFNDWAFNIKDEKRREKMWEYIPEDTDVLISHGPPHGYGDKNYYFESCGCKKLLARILETKIKLVICGHIHEGYGLYNVNNRVDIINASIMNYLYDPVNKPVVIDIEKNSQTGLELKIEGRN